MEALQLRRLYAVIAQVGGFEESREIKLGDRLTEDLELDSLDRQELAINLEEIFGVTIPDNEAQRWHQVIDAVQGVDAAVARERPPVAIRHYGCGGRVASRRDPHSL